jgi:Mg2+ and Co2+ transporter CorA
MLKAAKLDSGGVWIDLLDPSEEEMRQVERDHGVRVPPRAELEEIETSSRLSRRDDVLFMNMPVATLDPDGMLVPSPSISPGCTPPKPSRSGSRARRARARPTSSPWSSRASSTTAPTSSRTSRPR